MSFATAMTHSVQTITLIAHLLTSALHTNQFLMNHSHLKTDNCVVSK